MQPALKLSLPEQVASQAEFIVNNLTQTKYQHTDNIDVDRGIYECDCNGFAEFVLERAAPDHFKPIPKEPTQPRPRAFEYYVFFNSLLTQPVSGWHNIEFLKDARRGDMLAWRFPTVEKGHDTGHVVFIADTPKAMDNGIYAVRVYDSAATAHFEDTRATGTSGIGSGFINFKVDSAGKPISFQFAPPSSASFETLPISIGRLESFA